MARELGVSFAIVDRWENSQVKPSKLARAQSDAFCSKMIKQGQLSFWIFGLVSLIDEHTSGDLKSFRQQFANLSQEQTCQKNARFE